MLVTMHACESDRVAVMRLLAHGSVAQAWRRCTFYQRHWFTMKLGLLEGSKPWKWKWARLEPVVVAMLYSLHTLFNEDGTERNLGQVLR